MERLTLAEQTSTWMDETKHEERVRLNALLDGKTDGHTYSMRIAEPANPADGALMYFRAGVVGNAVGFYGKVDGIWKLIPQVTVQPSALWSIKTAGGSTYLHPIDVTTHMLVGGENMPTAFNLDVTGSKLAIAGSPLAGEGDLQALGSGIVTLKEATTPTADADHAKVYSKTDNLLYYQDGAGVEHVLLHDTWGVGVMGKGTRANQPAAATAGWLYWVSDEGIIERDTGSAWEQISFVDFVQGDKSTIFYDHFTEDPYSLDGSSNEISSRWSVVVAGTQPNPDCDYYADDAQANGVLKGHADSTTSGNIESQAGIVTLAQNPVLFAKIKWADSDDCQFRWGLASTTWTSGPTYGLWIEREYEDGVSDTWLGVADDTGGRNTVNLGTADGNWHEYKIKVTGGNAVEFFVDGVSKGSVGSLSLSNVMFLGGNIDNQHNADDADYYVDYTVIQADEL